MIPQNPFKEIQPVFIVGCDRSGTTMLGAMLGNHSECLTVPEAQFLMDVYTYEMNSLDQFNYEATLDKIQISWRFRLWEINVSKDGLSLQAKMSYPGLLRWLVEQYGQKMNKLGFSFWVDHTPTNNRSILTLLQIFPKAKFIHLIRDGRAVAASMMQLDWSLAEPTKIAHFWLERLSYGLAAEICLGPQCVQRVRYEDLVLNPDDSMHKLCEFLGIDFQPSMINPSGFNPPQYTSKQHSFIGKDLDAQRVNAWEKMLTPRQVELFEIITGDMLLYLGYSLKHNGIKHHITRFERFQVDLNQLVRGGLINRFKLWKRRRRSFDTR